MKRRMARQDVHKLIPRTALDRVAARIHERDGRLVTLPEKISLKDRTLLSLLKNMRSAVRDGSDPATLKSFTDAAAAHLLQTQGVVDDPQSSAPQGLRLSTRKIQQLQDYIESHLSGEVRVQSMASVAGMSRAQFVRRFKVTTGKTPHQFVIDARVRSAQALLTDGELSLAQIAERTGFATPSHFTAVFRRMVKVSPLAYRKQIVEGRQPARSEAGVQTSRLASDSALRIQLLPEKKLIVSADAPALGEFQLEQTSLLLNAHTRLVKSSKGLGWTDLFVAVTDEMPHDGMHGAVPAVWIVTATTSNDILRCTPEGRYESVLPENAISITRAGDAVYDEIGAPLQPQHLYLRQSLIDEVAEELFADGRDRRFIGSSFGVNDGVLRRLLAAIDEALREPPQTSRLTVEYVARALASHLLEKYSTAGPARPLPVHPFNARQISELNNFIKDNLSSGVSIADLANVVGLGRARFIQRFKASTLLTPHQAVIKMRIKRARKMLAGKNADYALIALACGFVNQSHFITMFKRNVGVTPHEYRRLIA
jgi:transcriptional regulator GlxA family with amidase domain